MPSVLAIIPGTTLPRRLTLGRIAIDVFTTVSRALDEVERRTYDLVILGPMEDEGHGEAAQQLRSRRRSRLTPTLFLVARDSLGIVIPRNYRPGVDSVARGDLESPEVQDRIMELIDAGNSSAEPVLVGAYELDTGRRRLRFDDGEISLTRREAELLAVLMARPNETVSADQILEDGWSTTNDPQTLQTLRRHVSNLRHKLESTPAEQALRTVRGEGYRFVSRAG